MVILKTDCELVPLSDARLIENFNCGDEDLNDFNFVFSTEEQERENLKNNTDILYTRQMFYDIRQWKDELIS